MRRPMQGLSASRWVESSHAEAAWGRSRVGSARWGWAGAVIGVLIGAVWFAPATWLADAVSAATQQRFMLADARGTVWSGSAVPVLTGGPGSRDASALPGRLQWTVRPQGMALEARLSQPCCLNGSVGVLLTPGLDGFSARLTPSADTVGQWPTRWLVGLGTPWNTLQLGGLAHLRTAGVSVGSVQGGWHLAGGLTVELMNASSPLSTLDTLGSYRLTLQGAAPGATAAAASTETAQITLSTLEGALQLSGSGTWGTGGLRFRGEAHSLDSNDAALTNLLSIIGRRDGARSVISIG